MKQKSMQITVREIVYGLFYISLFALAIFSGTKGGFRGDSHNAPGPFLVELFLLPVSPIIWLIDYLRHKSTLVHKIGFWANALVIVYTVVIALTQR
jgi:hypothetical protein